MNKRLGETRDLQTLDLVRLAKQGHGDAVSEIYARYSNRVRKIVRMRLGREQSLLDDSADILQRVFVDAFRSLDRFTMNDDSSLIRWLATFAKYRILEVRRFERAACRDRRLEVPLETPTDDGGVRELPLLANLPTPSMEVGRAEEAEAVRGCIAALDERCREVIIQRDYMQSSWADIAEDLGSPSAEAARALYDRALNKLGAELRRRGIESS
ncbi:MAG: RNA polymerase sigma factor (sigma-70 family) [Planctomycetota bacterium]|jgi:RNA polymerase sigma factor (sigma-70 family)